MHNKNLLWMSQVIKVHDNIKTQTAVNKKSNTHLSFVDKYISSRKTVIVITQTSYVYQNVDTDFMITNMKKYCTIKMYYGCHK